MHFLQNVTSKKKNLTQDLYSNKVTSNQVIYTKGIQIVRKEEDFLFKTLQFLGVHAYPKNPCFRLQKSFKHTT